jgi:flagellar basal-body rod protein FlgB
MFDLDSYVGIHARALQVRSQRSELIARNLANADTPDYKAQDLDFRSALAQAGSSGAPLTLSTTRPGHQSVAANAAGVADPVSAGALKYRNPLAPSLDGNTVDVQIEQGAFAENALRFQATLTFLNSRLRGLMTAITGQ